MKTTHLILAGGTLLIVSFGFVGTNEPEDKKIRTIEVTGSAEVEVPPDALELVIQITEFNREKRTSIENIQEDLFQRLEKAGIVRSNIVFKDLGNQYHWRFYWDWYYWGADPEQRPLVSKQFGVKVENMAQADRVVESLKMRGISSVALGKTSNKNISEYRKRVKLEAVRAAKEKAKYLLEAVDERLGSVICIKEVDGDSSSTSRRSWGHYGSPWWPYYGFGYYGGENIQNSNSMVSNSTMNAGSMNVGGGGGSNPAAAESGAQKIKLRYEVEAVFEIVVSPR